MKVLLDTNAFLRWIAGSSLPQPVERLLKKPDSDIAVSIVTGWEIVLKPKLACRPPDVEDAIEEMGAVVLPIKFEHLNELSRLPLRDDHRDPFDRMLIAQAIAEDRSIVTSDARFTEYKRLRVVWD